MLRINAQRNIARQAVDVYVLNIDERTGYIGYLDEGPYRVGSIASSGTCRAGVGCGCCWWWTTGASQSMPTTPYPTLNIQHHKPHLQFVCTRFDER